MVSIYDAIEGSLLVFSSTFSSSTERIYRVHLRQLEEYLKSRQVYDIDHLASQHFVDFFHYLKYDYKPRRLSGDQSPYAPASLANAWCAIRMLDKFLVDEFHLQPMTTKIKKPTWKPPQIEPLSKEEIEKILAAAAYTTQASTKDRKSFKMKRPTGIRDTCLVLILLDTGLRAGEVARLTLSDYNDTTGELRIKPFGSGRKTKPRTVYLGKTARRATWRYLAERKKDENLRPEDPFFTTGDDKPLTMNAIRLITRRLGERAGVANVHPHRFRHTFAIEFLRNGGNMYVLSEKLLGHSDLKITRRYLALVDEDAFNEHRQASPADRWRL